LGEAQKQINCEAADPEFGGGSFGRFGSFATRSSQRQVRVLSAMPPEAEVTFAAAFGTLRRPRCARRSIDRNR
jgi:hypothetical protein